MKWKDTGETNGKQKEEGDSYYEDDGYPSLKEHRTAKRALLSGMPLRYIFWGLGIAVAIFLILELGSLINGRADQARIEALENKIERIEQKLQEVDSDAEKVTHIWDQAKSYETFKTRFERSEASMSLRMDHLAMSLDALQKKSNQTIAQLDKLKKAGAKQYGHKARAVTKKRTTVKKTHTVAKGDTLYSISRKYNLSLDKLMNINKLPKGAVIHVGQVLVVNGAGG